LQGDAGYRRAAKWAEWQSLSIQAAPVLKRTKKAGPRLLEARLLFFD